MSDPSSVTVVGGSSARVTSDVTTWAVTATHCENSEVLPLASVAVAVMKSPEVILSVPEVNEPAGVVVDPR